MSTSSNVPAGSAASASSTAFDRAVQEARDGLIATVVSALRPAGVAAVGLGAVGRPDAPEYLPAVADLDIARVIVALRISPLQLSVLGLIDNDVSWDPMCVAQAAMSAAQSSLATATAASAAETVATNAAQAPAYVYSAVAAPVAPAAVAVSVPVAVAVAVAPASASTTTPEQVRDRTASTQSTTSAESDDEDFHGGDIPDEASDLLIAQLLAAEEEAERSAAALPRYSAATLAAAPRSAAAAPYDRALRVLARMGYNLREGSAIHMEAMSLLEAHNGNVADVARGLDAWRDAQVRERRFARRAARIARRTAASAPLDDMMM